MVDGIGSSTARLTPVNAPAPLPQAGPNVALPAAPGQPAAPAGDRLSVGPAGPGATGPLPLPPAPPPSPEILAARAAVGGIGALTQQLRTELPGRELQYDPEEGKIGVMDAQGKPTLVASNLNGTWVFTDANGGPAADTPDNAKLMAVIGAHQELTTPTVGPNAPHPEGGGAPIPPPPIPDAPPPGAMLGPDEASIGWLNQVLGPRFRAQMNGDQIDILDTAHHDEFGMSLKRKEGGGWQTFLTSRSMTFPSQDVKAKLETLGVR